MLKFLKMIPLFKFITPSLKPDMNDSLSIILIKIIIIMNDIIKIYPKNIHLITKEPNEI